MAWLGVRAGVLNLLLPVGEIGEVLPLSNFTPVPLTRSWYRGLSNVRGSLYSVIDLPDLLGLGAVPGSVDARLLLLAPARMRNTALLVTRLVGMHSPAALQAVSPTPPAPVTAPALCAALSRAWQSADQQIWYELDLSALVATQEFLEVAGEHSALETLS